MSRSPFHILAERIVECRACPRLTAHREQVARVKRRAYRDEEYWGRPVPGFGDPAARLLIVGLAPGAHGANRTGRMFTGDSSGDYLYRALHQTGFASQAESVARGDRLTLRDAWVTAAARCAPPDNRPSREEFERCSCFLEEELLLLHHVQVVVVLGRLAMESYLRILRKQARIASAAGYAFAHGARWTLPAGTPDLIASYHPSRQNTQTGRLTAPMMREIFDTARRLLT